MYQSSQLIFCSKIWGWIALVICLICSGCHQDQQQVEEDLVRPVKTLRLESVGVFRRGNYPGHVKANQEVNLAFKVPGILIEFPVKEGQRVDQGELVARVDPRDYQNHLDDAQARLAQARAQQVAMQTGARIEDIAALEAAVNAAEARLQEASQEYVRNQLLLEQRVIPQATLDQVESRFKVAQADWRTAQENLRKGRAGSRPEDLDAMEAQIQSLSAMVADASNALDDTWLRAPFTGVVAERFVNNHENVQAFQPIVKLQDISHLEIVINVPESDVTGGNRSKTLEEVQHQVESHVKFAVLPDKKFPVTLKEVQTQADPQTQTFTVKFSMPAPEDVNILPGMTATIFVQSIVSDDTHQHLFLVPVSAVFSPDGQAQFVWVIDPQTMALSRHAVELGEMLQDSVFVSGLEPGMLVAVSGVNYLREGQVVRSLN